ncbi:MAG: oxygenase MpaB family protein [Hyphomonadaceae bacterium]
MHRNLDRLLRDYIAPPPGMPVIDFAAPAGAPALYSPHSVTWRIMKNPVSLLVGGVAGVILELAEPRVRTGVWDHTAFRNDPVRRIRRTGYAAMATIYAPEAAARELIAGVVRRHDRVEGETPTGAPYRANDVELLNWVQATAAFGFFEAYHRFASPLSASARDALYREGAGPTSLYGARGPRSAAETEALFAGMAPKLERSGIVFEFLDIMRNAQLLPARFLQRLMVRGAVEIIPNWAREILGLGPEHGLNSGGVAVLRMLGALGERVVLESAPPAQACLRLGLRADHLYF